MHIRGEIIVRETMKSFSNATLHIYFEDVSRADASSTILSKHTLQNVSHTLGQPEHIDFDFEAEESSDPHARYNLRAHIDQNGNGVVEQGDLVTMQSYPVDSDSEIVERQLEVREV